MAICIKEIIQKTGYNSVHEAMVAFKEKQDPNGAWFCIESVRPMVNGLVASYFDQAQRLGLDALVDRNDLRQEAYAVLVQALSKFNPPAGSNAGNDDCGKAWNRYANLAIKSPIRDAFAKSVNTVSVPNWAIKAAGRIHGAMTEIELASFNHSEFDGFDFKKRPFSFSAIEIAKKTGIAPSTVKSYLAHGFHLHPATRVVDFDNERLHEDLEYEDFRDAPSCSLKSDETYLINKVFQALDEQQKLVVSYRFGLDGPTKTQDQVAQIVGLTKKQVRLIEQRAIVAMRDYLAASEEAV